MHTRSATAPVETIRSRQNKRVKDLRQRLRSNIAKDGLLAIEGDHLLREAVRSGLRINTLFLRENHETRNTWRLPGNPLVLEAAADAFDHASVTEAPQGIAALVEAPHWRLEAVLDAANPVVLVLAELQDPGNLGTIIRTAEAFGASGILLTPGTVSPWGQKALRASAGSIFRLPVVALETLAALERVNEAGIPMYATAAQGEIPLPDAKLTASIALVIGNEGAGISDSVRRFCAGTIHIPCPGPVESLNAAIAASIVLYETARQRGIAPHGKTA